MHIAVPRLFGASRLATGIGSLLACAVVAGCGHGAAGAGASSSPTPDAYQQARKFSQCMRDHGVNVPDPQTVNGGGVAVKVTPGPNDAAINPDSQQFKDAQNACKQYLPNGGNLSPEQQAQQQQNALKFAQCMRAHGVDIPDPKPGTGGVVIQGNGSDNGGGPVINPDDPKFQAAQKACQSLLGDPSKGGQGLQISNGNGG